MAARVQVGMVTARTAAGFIVRGVLQSKFVTLIAWDPSIHVRAVLFDSERETAFLIHKYEIMIFFFIFFLQKCS